MIIRCDVTKTAVELSLQLEVYTIPDDFDATGDRRRVIAAVRDQFTNYRTLLAALPACPSDCRLFNDKLRGQCSSNEFAHNLLETEARALAMYAYGAWLRRRKQSAEPDMPLVAA